MLLAVDASTYQVHTMNLHTTPGYPLAVHIGRNLVATGSTIRSAVMVWDLDRVETTSVPDIKVTYFAHTFLLDEDIHSIHSFIYLFILLIINMLMH